MDSLFNYNILGQVTHSPTKEQANHCRKIGCFLLFISCKIYIKKKHLSWNSTKGYFCEEKLSPHYLFGEVK